MAKMTLVIAVQPGHDGRLYRNAGEQFYIDVDDERFKGATWFVEPEKAPKPKPEPKDKRPPGAGPAKGSALNVDPTPGDARPVDDKDGSF